MDLPVLKNAEGYLKRQTRRRRWHRVFAGLAAVVVFCTTYALILPAITMTAEPFCGLEEHIHSDGCYEMTLVCAQDGADAVSDPAHEHTDDCWQTQQKLICTQEESGGHAHTDGCFDESGALICTQEESGSHAHTDGCFDESGALICTQEESGGHVHTDECFAEEPTLVCAGEPEAHEHTDDCYEMTLVCTLEEHEHSTACWSDPTADIETAAVWERTIPQELPEDRREALIAVAQSQLGYCESARNYSVDDAGKTRGYTRYGDWFGDKYGDWCAMFVSFCLHYAGIPESEMPYDANCGSWCAVLAERGLYFGAQDYLPQPGDLIFIDRDGDGTADHVGIVKELVSDETEIVQIKTIEGNSGNCAAECAHTLGDADILGFGVIPEEMSEEELAQAASVEALIYVLPDNDEISLTIASYEEAEDTDGLEEWYAGLLAQISEAKNAYDALSERQQALVTNAEKLLMLVELVGEDVLTENFSYAAPTVVQFASTKDFIDLNLYDYNGYINNRYDSDKKYPGFQWNGGAYMFKTTFDRHTVDYIDFGNSNITDRSYGQSGTGITNGKSANAVIAGVLYTNTEKANATGAVNWLWWDGSSNASITNRPVGMSTETEALSRKLGDDGYPVLTDGTSLAYLFTDDNYSVFKQNTESIDGLFQKDETTGAYFYNSRWNHAQYSNNMFTLYNQIITPNFIVYPFGNFLPFNTITDSSKATQVSSINGESGHTVSDYVEKIQSDMKGSLSVSPTKTQLNAMLEKYQNSIVNDNITTAKAAISDYLTGSKATSSDSLITDALLNKMYNIDWDEETNFFFGMDMSMNFIQPRGGLTGNDGQQKMVFYFTGDDDVWVYIDGALFLDLTGIHRHVGGEIDFVNGKVYYYALDTANGGDVSTTPYATYTFEELLVAAGKSTDCLNEKGTFKDYTTHSFKFFYMERGSGSSVCRMNFNFPLLRKNSITVSKELSVDGDAALLGNPDFSFQVLAENGTLFVGAGVEYEITDAAGNSCGTGTTDANGVFKLKAGQTAVFSGIDENKGKYFVRELLDEDVFAQYGEVTVDGTSTTTNYDVTVGSDSFKGLNSSVKDMSDGSTIFRFNNHVDTTKLSSLSITKTVEGYSSGARLVSQFEFEVTVSGEQIPIGTQYTVGTETRTVTQAGIISLRAGETAVIDNILAESAFTVEELAASAEGYIVSYSVNGTSVSGSAASGTISRAGETVSVAVLNREKGVTAEIPVFKTLNRPDNTEHSFTFTLQQVTDSTGLSAADSALTQELTLTLTDSAEGTFLIDYPLSALDDLPKAFYYKITENTGQGSNVIYDASVYVAEVTVSESGGELTADVTGIWKNGAKMEDGGSVAFVNTLGCYELPQTGGAGTTLYTAGGMLLIITAVLGLYRKKPRRREDNKTS